MRELVFAALLLGGCASSSLESRVSHLEVMQAATCQRFEEYQVEKTGAVTRPCHQQDGHAVLTPLTVTAK